MAQLIQDTTQNLHRHVKQGVLKNLIKEANEDICKKSSSKSMLSINLESGQNNSSCQNATFYCIFDVFQRRIKFLLLIFLDTQNLKVRFQYLNQYCEENFKNFSTISSEISQFVNNFSKDVLACKNYLQFDSFRFQFTFLRSNLSDLEIKKYLIASLKNFISMDKNIYQQFGKNLNTHKEKDFQITQINYQKRFSIQKKIMHYKILLNQKFGKKKKYNQLFGYGSQCFCFFYKTQSILPQKLMQQYEENKQAMKGYFQKVQQKVNQEINKQKEQNGAIAQSINNTNIQKQKFSDEFPPHLSLLKCQYKIVKTINASHNIQKEMINLSVQKKEQYLIMKQKKGKDKKFKTAFQNELKFLFKNRDLKCKSLAKYYLEQLEQPKPYYWKQKQHFYIQKYEMTLQNQKYRENLLKKVEKLIKFMYDVMKGIKFFHQNGLIHHDIKSSNILIDKQENPKIVDFEGISYTTQFHEKYNKEFDSYDTSIIVFSEEFHIKYQNLDQLIKEKYQDQQQYYYHALYDIYSYGKTFAFVNDICQHENNEKHQYLKYALQDIYLRCIEINPRMKMTPDQILTLLYLIQQKINLDKQKIKNSIQNRNRQYIDQSPSSSSG